MGILYKVYQERASSPVTSKAYQGYLTMTGIMGYCTLKFGLKWSYHLQNIFANPFEFYGLGVIKPQFCGCAQKRFGACRYHTGHEKKWAGKWDCYPSQKLSSFYNRKKVRWMFLLYSHYNTYNVQWYCRQYLLHVGLFWFHLSLYKSYLLFYSSLL